MLRPAAPRRMLVLASVVTVLALAATGCNAGRPPAAVVDGHEISAAMVLDFTEALTATEKLTAGQKSNIRGEGEGTFGSNVSAAVLSFLVERRVVLEEGLRRNLEPTAAQRTKAATDLYASLAGTDTAAGKKSFNRMAKATRDFLIDATAMRGALQAKVAKPVDAEAQAKATFDAAPDSYALLCLSTITVANDQIIALVKNRLSAGESFAAVAKDVSTDEGKAKGGSIGCIPVAAINDQTLAATLAATKVGQVVGPYGDTTKILIKVDDHKAPNFAAVKDGLVQSITQNGGATGTGETEMAALQAKLLKAAVVRVDPKFGRWSKANEAVLPPSSPALPKASVTTTTAPAGR